MKREISLAVLALFIASSALAVPSEISNQHPLGMMHLSTTPVGAAVPPAGVGEVSLSGGISNTLNHETDTFLIDAETREGAFALSFGAGEGLELSLRQAVQYRGGGWTDQPIDEWHQALGLPRGPRRKIPHDQFDIHGETKDGSEFSLERSGTAMSDLDLGMKYELWRAADGNGVLSLAPRLRLPTGADTFGQDSVDTGMSLLAARSYGALEPSAGLSYVHFFDPVLGELRFKRNHYGAFLAAEYGFSNGLSVVVDVLGESGLLDNLVEYPDYQTYLDAGLRYKINDAVTAEVFFREDPAPEDSTTDFTLFGALRWRFAV